MLTYRQVSGGNCRLVLYRELSPGKIDPADPGVIMDFISEGFSAPPNKQGSPVISGKRGQGKPNAGVPNFDGQVVLAPYAPLMGHVLRALCGKPVTSSVDDVTLLAEAVVDLGDGCVGLPVGAHDFVQDTAITITGTTHYNGSYRLLYGTDADVLVVKSRYVAETLTATAKAHRGLGAFLKGAAKDLGGGSVALPVQGVGVALNRGESVTISGSTGYDGTHTLQEGTSPRRLVISATYVEEAFDGSSVAVPQFYSHHFVLPKVQPTVAVEKYLDYAENAAKYPYTVFLSNKINGLSFPFGGESTLQITVPFAVGSAEPRTDPVKPSPQSLASISVQDREVALWLDGKRIGDIEKGNLSLAYGIEGKAAVGDMGKKSIQSEGDPVCTCSLTAYLQTDEYQQLSDMSATLPFALSISGAGGEELWFELPETEVDTGGAAIAGKAGVSQEITVTGFVDQTPTVNEFTLINRVASYA